MTGRTKAALAVTVVYIVVNLGGAIYAAIMREPLHAALHVALLLPGVWLFQRLASGPYQPGAVSALPSGEFPDRLTNLEQSIDAVAIEVERISEGQRFMTKTFTEKDAPPPSGQGAVKPGEIRKDRPSS